MNISTRINSSNIAFQKNLKPKNIKPSINPELVQSFTPAKPFINKISIFDKFRKACLPLAFLASLGIGVSNYVKNNSLEKQNENLKETLYKTRKDFTDSLKTYNYRDNDNLNQLKHLTDQMNWKVSEYVAGTNNKLDKFAASTNSKLDKYAKLTNDQLDSLKSVMPVDVPELVKKISPSSVQILAPDGSSGSGIIINDNKGETYVLTANHVVDTEKKDKSFLVQTYTGSDNVKSNMSFADIYTDKVGKEATDTICDLAILKFSDLNLVKNSIKPIELRDTNKEPLQAGESVFVIGNPLGIRDCVSAGVISSIERIAGPESKIMIQTDAAINPGNSGGMVVDEKGRLIGVVDIYFRGNELGDGNSLGCAVRVDIVKKFLKDNGIEAE